MTKGNFMKRTMLATTVAAILTASTSFAVPTVASAQPVGAVKPVNNVNLSVGTGRMVRLDGTMSDLFVANDAIADVQVRSTEQVYIFGKTPGETTVYATNKAGKVVYSANVRVGTNMGSVDELLRLAMPDAQIRATPMNGMMLLTGTVAAPADVEEAGRLVQAYVGEGTQVISRLKTATPLQVMLQVRIAEVSRTLAREIGVNLMSQDTTGGFNFGVFRGTRGNAKDPVTDLPLNAFERIADGRWALEGAGKLFGLDVASAIDLAEQQGLITTLAEPTLTALSGESASFLAGGEFPIPISQELGSVTIEYKSYGVGLAFAPTVLENGRISMRVRPEVSELSTENSIRLNGFDVPALTTRRAETTVELGSGQSFMIGGLLRNTNSNTVDRAPGIGNLPIIGALFRSNRFRRNETELMIIVTPYLVRPVNANQIALPTDGYRSATTLERVLLDKERGTSSNVGRPQPVVTQPQVASPGMDAMAALPAPQAPAPVQRQQPQTAAAPRAAQPSPAKAAPAPGFSF